MPVKRMSKERAKDVFDGKIVFGGGILNPVKKPSEQPGPIQETTSKNGKRG